MGRPDQVVLGGVRTLAKLGSLSATALGVLVVGSRWLNVPLSLPPVREYPPMAASAGVCFVLAGLALYLSLGDGSCTRRRAAAQGCSAAVLAVGLATLLFHGFGLPELDRLLGIDVPDLGPSARMAPAAALAFVLFALTLLPPAGRTSRPASWAAAAGLLTALVALLTYPLDFQALYLEREHHPMALHAAAGLTVLFVCFLLAHPVHGWLATASGAGTARGLVHQLMPIMLAAPFVLGWLAVSGREASLEDPTAHTAPLAFASIAVLTVMVWRAALGLDRSEAERVRSVEALRESEAGYRAIFDTAVDAVVVIDERGTMLSFNPAAQRLFGYKAYEVVGRNVSLLMPEPHRSRHDPYIENYKTTGERKIVGIGREVEGLRRDGTTFPLEVAVAEATAGGRRLFTGIMRDISQRVDGARTLEQRARRQSLVAAIGEQALSNGTLAALMEKAARLIADDPKMAFVEILESSPDGQTFRRRAGAGWRTGRVVDATTGARADVQPGYTLKAGEPVLVDDVTTDARFTCPPLLAEHGVVSSATVVIGGQGRPYGVLVAHSREPGAFNEEDSCFLQAVANVLGGAAQRERAERRLRELALFDTLTGLPNRVLFRDRLEQSLVSIQRSNRSLALLLLDLDHFKEVNDTLGHPLGDQLLKEAAGRLRQCVRAMDTVARLGGDEFALVLPRIDELHDAVQIGQRVLNALRAKFVLEGHEVFVGASIGIAIAPANATDADQLLRYADLALYRAKAGGRDRLQLYVDELSVHMKVRKSMESQLRRALEQGDLDLYFQPQFELGRAAVTGAEALLRWHHAELGTVPPDRFISLAEDSGLIQPLGRWVLRRACQAATSWRRDGVVPLVVAVNVSLVQLRCGAFAREVEEVVAESGHDPTRLELEFTESLFSETAERCILKEVQRLREIGIGVTIDDFGTGYSSLSRLKRLPVDKVKIDRSFIAGLDCDQHGESTVRAILWLARSLGLQVVAEGVESETQLKALRAMGCPVAQGYHLGDPLPARDFASFVRRHWSTNDDPVLRRQAIG